MMMLRSLTRPQWFVSAVALVLLGFAGACLGEPSSATTGLMKESPTPPSPIEQAKSLTDAQWRERLDAETYRILREAGTERAFGDVYDQFKGQGEGDYYCAGCGTLLFSSAHKFDSHCGWPSFYDPAQIDTVKTRRDESLGMVRIEVVCARCEGHLGHLFEGEGFNTPTDQRYCINGQVLVFVPRGEDPPPSPVVSSEN